MDRLVNLIPFFVVLLTFPSVAQWVELPIGNTTVWWVTEFLTLYAFYQFKKQYYREVEYPKTIKFFLIWVVVSAIYGSFMADYYWDYKLLINNLMIYLMGMSFFYLSIPENVSKISRQWCCFAIVAFWFFLPFMQLEAPGKFLSPFAFLVIFLPFYEKKWKIVVIFFFLAVFLYGSFGARSTAIRFAFAILLSFVFLKIDVFSLRVIKKVTCLLFVVPFVLLILGLTGIFNIWKMDDYLGDKEVLVTGSYSMAGNNTPSENLKSDTRTFIYEETISSAIRHNYIIQGRSLARGYDSPFFSWMADLQFNGTPYHKGERQSSEVSILNVFTYMGLIGVCLYALIFLNAIRNVFKYSNNKCMYIIALYVSFRWAFAWMEDFTRFDLNNLYLWVILSMCYSPYFLQMTDGEFKLWAYNIFSPLKRKY